MKLKPKIPLIKSLAATFSLVAIVSLQAADDGSDVSKWIPPGLMAEENRPSGGEQLIPEITLTETPKPTADASKFTRTYTIELEKFGISNDGTNAIATSKGINEALQQAKKDNFNHIVFPAGTYLIAVADPVVFDLKDTVVDLNGATLQIESNGELRYGVALIVTGAENFRLTNGTLRGDRDTHDYKSIEGTHEWGTALRVNGGRNLEIDHLTLTNGSGDGIATGHSGAENRPELLASIFYSVKRDDLESGGLSDEGTEVVDATKMRTKKSYEMKAPEFELGYIGGSSGFPFIKSRVYQVCFYDENDKLMEKRKVLQFRKVQVPTGAKFARYEFNQSEVPEEPMHTGAARNSWIFRINNFKPPVDVHFHHNQVVGNRRLGAAFTGGQRWLVEENHFGKNGGTSPAYGVDFEDGAELMHDFYLRKNTFKDNVAGDLVFAAGTEVAVEDNIFEKNVVVHGRPHNLAFRGNQFNGGKVIYTTRTGVMTIENNVYQNCEVAINFDPKGVADGLVRSKPGEQVVTPPLVLKNETFRNVRKVGGTYLDFVNSSFAETNFEAGDKTTLVRFVDCNFTNSRIDFTKKGPEVLFSAEGSKGNLEVVGDGLERKKMLGEQSTK